MRFGVLGPLAAWTDEGRPVRLPELKVRALLADLLTHEGRPVSVDRLIDDLWPTGDRLPRNPINTLQTRVSQLRRALEEAEPGGRELVVSQPPGYLLALHPQAVDSGRFRTLVEQAGATDDLSGKAGLLADALELWRGTAYADFADEAFARPAAIRLEEERLAVLEEHAEVRLELGDHSLLVGELGDLVARHPLRERLRGLHLRALYLAGRQNEALASYTDLRERLADELGLDPSPDLAALHEAILRQDPALGANRSAAAPWSPAASHPVTPSHAAGSPAAPRKSPASRSSPTSDSVTPPRSAAASSSAGASRLAAASGSGALPRSAGTSGLAASPGLTGAGGASRPSAASGLSGRGGGNLPAALTELVGRDEALARVRGLVDRARLVTLTGPGGVGKTRLAVETGRAAAGAFTDGVWLVELAALEPASGATPADVVATALGIRDDEAGDLAGQLANALRGRRLLLVLDNCEHVIEPVAALVESLLKAVPELHVLATSQEPLGMGGETLWTVPPLAEPSAVELFVARATAAAPGFALTSGNAEVVAAICRRLDGIPLALELAATRVRGLGVQELAERLDDRFRVLTSGQRGAPPRQQTLRAMIDWSWELLTEPERAVLRRLAVYAGGFTLASAERVTGLDVLDVLPRLVDRSLVLMTDGPRYRLLESVKAYCVERLREAGEYEEVRRGHLAFYTELAERAEPHLRGPGQREWLERLDRETAELRAAFEGATTAESALRLVNALAWYWYLRGRWTEAQRSLEWALGLDGGSAPARAQALVWQAGLALLGSDGAERSDAAYERIDDPVARARARWFLGFAQRGFNDLSRTTELVGGALDEFRALDDRWGVAAALSVRATVGRARGNLAQARLDAAESEAGFRELGDSWGRLKATNTLGELAEIAGDYDLAARLHREGLRMAEELELWTDASFRLSGLGRIALLTGDFAAADEFHRRALRLAAGQSNKVAEHFAEVGLALSARRQGRFDLVEEHLTKWVGWIRGVDGEPGLALVLAELGFAAERRGDAEAALAFHLDGLTAARKIGDPRAVALAYEGLAGARSLAGEPGRAARLLGAAAALRESVGAPLPEAERGDVDRISAAVRKALGDEASTAEFERGVSDGL
ncbi:BTAD domain-containing putative transcriptional regulator [Spirillospora sp. NPDC048911]|uniref:AfsR/SARP family transcriptional regulator n=1 Tax=Spirillospora sp. NPDC048911 TaxID=3364527 RepID=UPI003716C21D